MIGNGIGKDADYGLVCIDFRDHQCVHNSHMEYTLLLHAKINIFH